MFLAMNVNNCQPRLLYAAKVSFKIDGERTFQNKHKMRYFITSKSELKKTLQGNSLFRGRSKF